MGKYYNDLLVQLLRDSSEIRCSALLSKDGIMLATETRGGGGVSEDRVAAMSAAMHALSNQLSHEVLQRTQTECTLIKNHIGYVIIKAVTIDLLLTVIAVPNAKLAMVFYDIEALAHRLQTLIYGTL